ncbi:MAG: TIGR04086 family membrane protein [Clostridia bacterium]|nr:TIGR04086 family membrane protein [Clostridia bacterium]
MHKSTHRKKRNAIPAWDLLKAVLLAAAAATGGLLLLALLLYLEWLPDGAIPVGNAIIKVLAAAFAGWLIGRKLSEKTWLLGGIAGLFFTVLTTAIFSLLIGSFRVSWTLLSDALISFALGAAVATVTARMRAKKAA